MKSICIFAGSSAGNHEEYRMKAKELGRFLAERNIRLIYGGSKTGLMGEVANEVLSHNGEVTGIMPSGLLRGEIVHAELTELIEVDSMHERKAKMASLADGFIALPGGLGTFEELFEVLCWSQIGIHEKPIGLYNVRGYYDPLLALVHHSAEEGFAKNSPLSLLHATEDPAELIQYMADYETPVLEKKWQVRNEGEK
ncbi:TIGR00730 family Rossman fold protein [Metabacillus sp. GX 13764]|uniref:LOG family protein n=1 Tax=Metabacillus kandeliae TaxID=2900151 RepID=UPI001E49538D|nr:TIGR00730 family Rossman fold protein [Metabacillus kandeliae]MCD7036524.1 TIGR00730 family Rossman fold protein [Metabacillus kandeliae]